MQRKILEYRQSGTVGGGRMTEQEAKDVLEAYMKCEKRKNNLVYEEKCNNDCDNCELCYEKGTVGEHKEAVEMAIKALEEIKQYRTIGTPEECRAAVEKQKVDKELESHDEKHILKSCLGLMQDMVDEFAEWYRWQHGEDSIEKLDEEERFCIRKTYFRIVQELFLLHTNHSGGTSTRAKCKQLGVDWGEEIEFDWSDENEQRT